VAEEADDPLDRLFHAVEILESRIDLHRPVHEDPAEPRVLAGIDHDRLADRRFSRSARPRRSASIVATLGSFNEPAVPGRRHGARARRSA
jgi:hypothetical protein